MPNEPTKLKHIAAQDVFLDETGGAKLSRIYEQMKAPFGIISAFTNGQTEKENLSRTIMLLKDLRKLNLGGTKMEGHFEDGDYVSDEISFFIPYKPSDYLPTDVSFSNYIQELGHKYDQVSVLIGDGVSIYSIEMAGHIDRIGNALTMKPEAMTQFWSKLKKRKFVFTDSGEEKLDEDCVEHDAVFKSDWTTWQDRDGIYLRLPGSNSVWVGFCSQKEADDFSKTLNGNWKVYRNGAYKNISDEEIYNAVHGEGEYDPAIRTNRMKYGLYCEPVKYIENISENISTRMIVPDVGTIIEVDDPYQFRDDSKYNGPPKGKRHYRVNSWLKAAPEPKSTNSNSLSDTINSILDQGHRRFNDNKRLMWCSREEAEYLSCSGVSGAIIPVRDAKVIGRVNWSEDQIESHRNQANQLIGKMVF